jgi:energy-coupling factor transporter ATP-binding protein EcfA2
MAARRVEVAGHVAVTAAAGDVVAVEGVNGAGKSTLLAAAAGLLPAGQGSRHPPTVGYAPERGDTLTTLPVRRWLLGLAQTAGLSRHEAGVQVDDLLDRLGLAYTAARPLRALSRGNLQRALIAQALIGPPDLLVLDEPGGGLDEDGVRRLTAEIQHASQRSSVVLVARHPTAPVPLPAGPAWRLCAGTVRTEDRLAADPGAEAHAPEADGPGVEPGGLVVETGDGVIRRVSQADLPAVLLAALDAGLLIRRVQPVQPGQLRQPARLAAASPLGRAGSLSRVMHGAAHRARLLTRAQWAVAPAVPGCAGDPVFLRRRAPTAGRRVHGHRAGPADGVDYRARPARRRSPDRPRVRRARRRPGPRTWPPAWLPCRSRWGPPSWPGPGPRSASPARRIIPVCWSRWSPCISSACPAGWSPCTWPRPCSG